jgi:hypothetical protein
MPAARVRQPKIEDLNLSPVQLAKAQDFVEELGIGVKDPLYYYALLWCKDNEKSNGDYLSNSERKKFDSEILKKRRGSISLKILGDIALLESVKKETKNRQQQTSTDTAQQIRSAKTKVLKKKAPAKIPPPKLTLTIDKTEVEKGGSYTVTWKAENAITVSRSIGFYPRILDVELSGSRTITADRIGSKTYGITVRSSTGRGVFATAKIQIVEVKTVDDPVQKPQPKTPGAPRVISRTLSRSGGPEDSSRVLNDINKSLDTILKILQTQNMLTQSLAKMQLKEAENERRRKKESVLESVKNIRQKAMEKAFAPIKNIFEQIWKFIYYTLLGRAFTEFIRWAGDPKNSGKIKSISRFLKDFWFYIGGAAMFFLTPLGSMVKGVYSTIKFFGGLLLKSPLLLGSSAVAGIAVLMNEITGQRAAAPLQAERAARVQSGKTIDIPGVDVMNEKYKTPGIAGRTGYGLLGGLAYGGIVTPGTGMTVKGAGVDTQLVPIKDGGSVVLQKGETVLQKGARERMMSATGIDPLLFNIGPNANKPRTIGSKLTAMSTGGIVGGKSPSLLNSQARHILNRLIRGGLTPTAAAGIVSNIGVESAYTYDPNTHQGGGGPGRGLVQWEKGGRFDTDNINLQSFAKSRGKSWNDMDTQIDFILHELNNHPEYKAVKNKINKSKSISDATGIFLKEYEKAGTPHIEDRLKIGSELAKSGWLNPPKKKESVNSKNSGFNPLALLGGFPRPVSAEEMSKPTRPKVTPKPQPKPKSQQRSWWDPRGFMGLKKGGFVSGSLPVVGSDPEDRHMALLKAGEYIVPKLTVQKLGVNFFDNIVSNTDPNSNAARVSPISREYDIPMPVSSSGAGGAFITLPPIMKSAMADSTETSTTSVPSFSAISPMGNGVRGMLAEIYGIG